MSSLQNNLVVQLRGKLTVAGMTVPISNDVERKQVVSFTDAYLEISNEKRSKVERVKGSASAGVLTLSKRGLDQSNVDVEVPALRWERGYGTKLYITYLSTQILDKNGNNTFGGTQTFNNVGVTNNSVLTNISVSGKSNPQPNFTTLLERDTVYTAPVNGDKCTILGVDYSYNGTTVQWEAKGVITPPPPSSEGASGILPLATNAETIAGLNNTKAITPLKLKTVTDVLTTSITGASQPEALFEKNQYLAGEPLLANDSLFTEISPTFAGLFSALDDFNNATYSTSGPFAGVGGYRIQARANISINSVNKDTLCTATRALLKTDTGNTTIAIATFVGNIATFSGSFDYATNAFFRIELDNNGSSFTYRDAFIGSPIIRTNITYATGSNNGNDSTSGTNIISVNTINRDSVLVQNIGDITANTRVSFIAIGSGVANNALKLSFIKTLSPSPNLLVRIETVSGGNPTGTLVNANATATVTAASITTSLVDTTITLAGSITIPRGQQVAIVISAVGDVVNASNFYGVGITTNNTTTRPTGTRNGSVWTQNANKFGYISSTLFENTLLSETSASFSYKLPTDYVRLATQAYSVGQSVTSTYYGLTTYPGLVDNTIYYVANTPGLISAVSGTNSCVVGKNTFLNKMLITKKLIDFPITVGASPFSFRNTTTNPIQIRTTGGTVSSITTKGVSVATATNNITTIANGERIIVTYTVLPTMVYSEL